MKKLIAVITIIIALAVLFTACGKSNTKQNNTSLNNENQSNTSDNQADTVDDSASDSNTEPSGSKKDTLVVVFSATGTTKAAAQRIAAAADADFYEIKAAQEYTSADINWHDKNSRTTLEQNDKSARPAIGSADLSLDGYKTVYIGYPIWWGEEPRIIDTFVEKYDFDGITCIPFCTSGGSGVGRSDKNLADNAGSGNWNSGKLLNNVSDDELQSWTDSVK